MRNSPGFWSVRPDTASTERLIKMCEVAGIVGHALPEFHATLARDENNPYSELQPSLRMQYSAQATGIEFFGENEDVMVITLDSPDLQQRHTELHAQGDRAWSWPEFKPHITLATKISAEQRANVEELFVMAFPFSITLTGETAEYVRS